MKLKIAQFGLGPIGLETLKLAAEKPWVEITGAIDIDPQKAGADLGALTRIKSLKGKRVYKSLDEMPARQKPRLIFHTAVSRLQLAAAQIIPFIQEGISVVSSCEELLYPAFRDPKLAGRLDALCKKHGARVIGTGVNPGFVMDALPVCLTGVSRNVRAIHAQRVVNASTRRGPLQKKIGSGLPPAEFRRLFKAAKAGHAGLKDSVALIAHALGWKLSSITETGDAVVATRDIRTQHVEVRKGQTCGLHQTAEGRMNGKVRISLDLKMYLDAPNPHDAIQIEGEPPLRLELPGGVAGDQATVAALVNTAARILQAPAGLLTMADISLPRHA